MDLMVKSEIDGDLTVRINGKEVDAEDAQRRLADHVIERVPPGQIDEAVKLLDQMADFIPALTRLGELLRTHIALE